MEGAAAVYLGSVIIHGVLRRFKSLITGYVGIMPPIKSIVNENIRVKRPLKGNVLRAME
jgi:hypothetical protein